MRHVHAAVRTLFGKGSALDRSRQRNVFCLRLDLVDYRRVIKHLLGERRSAFGYARDALRATARLFGHVLVTLEARSKDTKRAKLLEIMVGDGGFEPPTPAV